jgi:hypothetical protein
MTRNMSFGPGSSVGSVSPSLHERLRVDLAQGFKDAESDFALGSSAADLVIKQGKQVAIVEVKTGDPELPLPSSTSSQMRLLSYQARELFPEKEVLPVLITNYRVSEDDEKEFKEQGIKLVSVAATPRLYNREKFSQTFADIVGLLPDVI